MKTGYPVEDYYLSETADVPNNLLLPLLVYRAVLTADDLAFAFEATFAANHWKPAWRFGIHPFAHYHSTAHEVIGVFRGTAAVLFGHTRGLEVMLNPGDAVAIPAGTGHQCIHCTSSFQAVGAYPNGTIANLKRAVPQEMESAKIQIDQVPLPEFDPIYGEKGPLVDLW